MASQDKPYSDHQIAEGLEVHHDNAPPLAYGHDSSDNFPLQNTANQHLDGWRERERKWTCGVPLLWILIAIISFIVGGAIGGGVGAGVRLHDKSSSPSSTSGTSTVTITSTTTAATATITNTINDAGCPYKVTNGSTYTSLTSTDYTILCNTDLTPGVDINNPKGDILGTSIYSCLDACTEYNTNATAVAQGGTCIGATWAIYDPGNLDIAGHCYLKATKETVEMGTGVIGLCGVVQG